MLQLPGEVVVVHFVGLFSSLLVLVDVICVAVHVVVVAVVVAIC